MKCNIYLKIGDESFLIAEGLDSSLTPSEINQDFLNLVKSSEKIDILRAKLEEVLLEGILNKPSEGINTNTLGDYQVATTTAKEISLSCPEIKFPSIDLSKVKVKQVDNFENYGSDIIVKQSPNGEPIYVLDGKPSTIRKFARHLAVEDAINNNVLDKLDQNSEEIKIIDEVLEVAKVKYPKEVKDRKSLLKHFIKNKSSYSRIPVSNGYKASVALDEILPLIEQIYYPKNNNYTTPLLKNLHGPGGIVYNNGTPQISYSNLYNILSGLVSLSMFKSQKEFNDLLKSNEKFENQKEYERLLNLESSEERSKKIQELLNTDKTFKTLNSFFSQFNLDILDPELFEESNYNILFNYIFSKERGYPHSYLKTTQDGIIQFKSNYYSLKDNYGLSYDTIISLPKYEYKSWHILEYELPETDSFGNPLMEYFISPYEFQENTKVKAVSSLKEAYAEIDKRISQQTFKESFFIELYQNSDKVNTFGKIKVNAKSSFLQKGNIVKIPNISLPTTIKYLDAREMITGGNNTLEDFERIIKMWPIETQNLLLAGENNPILSKDAERIIRLQNKEIQELLLDQRTKKLLPNALEIILNSSIPEWLVNRLVIKSGLIADINTIDKAGLFLSLLNSQYENRERTPEVINDILNQIREANKTPIYYYVESEELVKIPRKDKNGILLKNKQGKILYNEYKELKVVKIPNPNISTDEEVYKNGFQYPIISFWENSAQTLNNVFGTKINILTQSEIQDKFGNRYAKEKAFIIGDEVYINSTLGSTEDLFHEYIHIIMGYLKVNNPEVYNTLLQEVWKYTNPKDRNNINTLYKDDSYIQKLEENFAKRFSEHIYSKGQSKLDEIFNSNELEEACETIFDKADFNLKELGEHELSEIFSRFSSEISIALQQNDKLFRQFASSDKFRLNNKKTNLLKKWIEEGKIKEFNCR